jgi:hypothetical protein
MLDSEQLAKIKGEISNDPEVASGTVRCCKTTCRLGTISKIVNQLNL